MLLRPSDEASAPNACCSAGGKAPAARPRPLPVPAHPASGRWQLVSVGPNAANARSSRSTCIGASGRYASSPCNDQSPSVVLNDMPYSLMFCGYSTCNLAVSKPTTRSEEHTSELPSLMRISYAVFCLKKKKKKHHHHTNHKI